MKQKIKLPKHNGFTLIEVLISLSVFFIILLFLYKTLDLTKHSSSFYKNKLEVMRENNDFKNIFYQDFANADLSSTKDKYFLKEDKNENSIISYKSTNTYHNPFFTNITYFLSNQGDLLRVESKNPLKREGENYQDSYIDILKKNINIFKLKKINSTTFVLAIKQKNKNASYLSLKILNN